MTYGKESKGRANRHPRPAGGSREASGDPYTNKPAAPPFRNPREKAFLSQLNAAVDIWKDIRTNPSQADRWLGNYFHKHRKRFGARDRRFLSEAIYAMFRHKTLAEMWALRLGYGTDDRALVILASIFEGFLFEEDMQLGSVAYPALRSRLIEAYPLLRVQSLPPGYIPADKIHFLSERYSFPLWLVERWHTRYGTDVCEALLKKAQSRPPLTVRANPIKISRDELMKRFEQKGWKVSTALRSPYGIQFEERTNIFDTDEFREGLVEIQDEGSQLVCVQIAPEPGEVIWDVCAGGGGKSLLLAAMMKNKGRVIATDIRPKKLEELKKRAQRAGIYNIFPADLSRMKDIREAKKGFDRIIVDAPCSGTGTLRRNPDAKWKLDPARFPIFHRDQLQILENALPYLKPGGRLYYITCSLEPEENDEVIRELLSKHSQLEIIPHPLSKDGFFRLLPHTDGCDGFFLAMLQNKK